MVNITDIALDGSWSIAGRPHGGYLLAAAVAPVLDPEHPHPLTVSAIYTSPPDPGPARVRVDRLRTGRRVASSRTGLDQGGVARVEALVSSGTLHADRQPLWQGGPAPLALPDPETLPRAPADRPDGLRVGVLDHVELRLMPDPSPGEVWGWMRRTDGADASPLDLLVFADVLPPVTFGWGLFGWVPTIELTVLVRGLPAPGWVRAVQRSSLIEDGFFDEECLLWDSRGRLVAQARQLASYRLPEGHPGVL